jgi:hypothetical protein
MCLRNISRFTGLHGELLIATAVRTSAIIFALKEPSSIKMADLRESLRPGNSDIHVEGKFVCLLTYWIRGKPVKPDKGTGRGFTSL